MSRVPLLLHSILNLSLFFGVSLVSSLPIPYLTTDELPFGTVCNVRSSCLRQGAYAKASCHPDFMHPYARGEDMSDLAVCSRRTCVHVAELSVLVLDHTAAFLCSPWQKLARAVARFALSSVASIFSAFLRSSIFALCLHSSRPDMLTQLYRRVWFWSSSV